MASMRVKLALSTLCENPRRRTGLSTFFPEFIAHARRIFPDVSWVVFAGSETLWPEGDPEVEICRDFPSNERPARRLLADHLAVAHAARIRGASALLTVGFFPLRPAGLPIVMHVFAVAQAGKSDRLRSAYRRWATRRGIDHAVLIIANSEWTRSRLEAPPARVLVSPEGLRHDIFRPEGPRGAPGLPGKYILWASNLYAYKRIDLALAAYAGLPAPIRSEFPLVVAGGGWDRGREGAEAAVERLSIRENVHFLGWVDDELLPSLYRGAVAHVLSTSQETFGRSVLEAMACGCPSLLQDLAVLREVAGDCAVYVDYADVPRASLALERICLDAGQRAALGSAGIERARHFSFERLAKERVGAILSAIVERP
jgi:glycosyltransferase involved in cell wall biosynthesis